MNYPLSVDYPLDTDLSLIQATLAGSKSTLETLIKRHQHFIYNIAHKMMLSPFDAEDITQEVLVIMITKLGQFNAQSSFRTWLYRIVFNHTLQMKKRWLETYVTDFESYEKQLGEVRDEDLSLSEQVEHKELIEEAKLGCMAGMLLCLSRDQRLVYILGEIFEVNHNLGAELLQISKDNFRQQLARARKDLYQFMNRQCGLVNSANPCRCQRKTKGFIEAGWVDPAKMKFNTAYRKQIHEVTPSKAQRLDTTLETRYAELFRQHPFQEKPHAESLLKSILQDKDIRDIFDLK